jgi:hypothetical protein
LTDEVWSGWFPDFQVRVELDVKGFHRLSKSIELGKAATWQYRCLAMGRVTDPLTVDQIALLAKNISALKDGGLEVAIDLMAMVIHCTDQKDEKYKRKLAQACEDFLEELDWVAYPNSDDSTDHDMGVIIEFSLSHANYTPRLARILENLLGRSRASLQNYARNRGRLAAPFFKYFPIQALDAVYVPDQNGKYRTAWHLVSDPYRENKETAIRKVPDEKLVEWCNKSPTDRYLFAANACKLFVRKSNSSSAEEIDIAPTAVLVMQHASDPRAVLKVFLDRFHPNSWSGSFADVLQNRLKMLDKLNPTGNKDLEEEIDIARKEMVSQIAYWRKREDDGERSRTGSFE